MGQSRDIVISGAGLVGALWAYVLKKRGHRVRLYEKRSDMRLDKDDTGRSINLIVTSRALNVLKLVGLDEDALNITIPVTGRMMHSTSGDLTYQAYGRDDSECNYSISRSGFNKLLLSKAEEAGVELFFEAELLDIDFDNQKSSFKDQTEVSWDHFFGCDGAGSPTRKALVKKGIASDSVEWLGADYKELFMPATSNGEYPIEKKALHIWPRGNHMLMALPNLDGSFTMTLYMPSTGPISFENLKTNENVLSYFKEFHGDSIELMPGFEEEFFQNPQGRLGTVRTSKWNYKGKVALLGDAAHAIVPFFGQGMNCGVEDIFYLASLMDKYSDDWESVFEDYDRLQRPNADAIADMALENFIEMADKVGNKDFLLRKKVESIIEKEFSHKYRARYGMVTYTLIPYAYAQMAGKIQDEILNELCSDIESADQVDLNKAEVLIDQKFIPFIKEKKIQLERFRLDAKTSFDPTAISFS